MEFKQNIYNDQAWKLYFESFPLCEQRPYEDHIAKLSDPAFHADVIVEDDQFQGILYYWIYDDKYCYVEHLATRPEQRGSGCGARAMKLLQEKGLVIILEIDPPVDEISKRRQGFYERQGLVLNPYLHIHPSYRPSTEPHELRLMSWPRPIDEQEFARFRDYAINHVIARK